MKQQSFDWRTVIQAGLVSGVIVLYVGMVGMIAAFSEREVIRDLVTLGQLLLFLPPLFSGYLTTRRLLDGDNNLPLTLLGGLIIGLLTAVPTIIMVFISEPLDVRSVLVNVDRDWLEVVTFDNRSNLVLGSGLLLAAMGATGLAGSLVYLLPEKIRRPLIFGFSFTLIAGMFGETLRLILQEILPDDSEALDTILRRDTLRQAPALVIFLTTTISRLIWEFVGSNVTSGYQQMPESQKTPIRWTSYVLLMGFLLVLPFLIGRSLSDVMVTVGLYVLMGLGLNIAIGLAGLLDLGYVTNYAVGAYVMAILTSTGPQGVGPEFINFWLVIPVALLSAMFTGFIFAVPVLKMRGDYLAIATLGFGEIIGKLAISDALRPLIGGAQGVLFIPKPVFFGIELKNPEQLYYIVLAACIVTLIVSIRLNNSRTGRQWMAIREDEDVAAAMGIDVARAKLLAFTVSAATGGVAGAIFAAKVGTVFPNSFIVLVSINVLSLIIVGGMGSNPGIVLGAIVLLGMPQLLREFTEYRWLLYGALLIFMMINRPEGFIPSQVRQRELEETAESQAEAKAAAVGD